MKANSKEIILEFNLQDFEKKDIKVRVAGSSLWIKADRKNKSRVKQKDFFQSERSHQRFYYATTLPKINHKKVKVEFKKGVLKISAPRK